MVSHFTPINLRFFIFAESIGLGRLFRHALFSFGILMPLSYNVTVNPYEPHREWMKNNRTSINKDTCAFFSPEIEGKNKMIQQIKFDKLPLGGIRNESSKLVGYWAKRKWLIEDGS